MNKAEEQDKQRIDDVLDPKSFSVEGNPEQDEDFSMAELRVAGNSSRFKQVEEAVKQAEIGIDMLLEQWENICTLNDYLDSGEWQADFEADERGEISKDGSRAVLSEDGLYNLLDRLQDVLGQMAALVDHVVIPEGEEN